MTDVLYLAARYLRYHRWKTAILVMSITLIIFLPVGLRVLVDQSAAELTARARSTPLLVGAKGSPLELVLNSLYFESNPPAPTHHAQVTRVAESDLALAIPLLVRHRVRSHPIVGTTIDYLDFRGLRPAAGRSFAVLGECVLGARAAESLGVDPGGSLVSSPESVFDLAGVYPLKMTVVGVLAPSHTPDDLAIFTDLKTTWVIAGLGHGHQDLAEPESAAGVLTRENRRIVANASVVQYNEITPDNADSFHFHGDTDDYPVTAIVAVPRDTKSGVLLRGRYEGEDDPSQIVQPSAVMEDLLGTILTVRSFLIAAILIVASSTVATAILVFLLSLRLRRREIETMVKIGGSRAHVVGVLVTEVAVILVVSAGLAAGLTLLTGRLGSSAIRAFLLS